VDGLHLIADVTPDTVFDLRTPVCERKLRPADFPSAADVRIPIHGSRQFLILGRGRPDRGPRLPRSIALPPLFQPPKPKDPIPLPDNYWTKDESVVIHLPEKPPGALSARRAAQNDGRLYIEIHSQDAPLSGTAGVEFAGKRIGSRELTSSLWLSAKPRIGVLNIQVRPPPKKAR